MRHPSAERLCCAQVKSLTAPAQFIDLVGRNVKLEEALERRKAELLRGQEAFRAAVELMDREQKALLAETLGLNGQARLHSAQCCAGCTRIFQDAL